MGFGDRWSQDRSYGGHIGVEVILVNAINDSLGGRKLCPIKKISSFPGRMDSQQCGIRPVQSYPVLHSKFPFLSVLYFIKSCFTVSVLRREKEHVVHQKKNSRNR